MNITQEVKENRKMITKLQQLVDDEELSDSESEEEQEFYFYMDLFTIGDKVEFYLGWWFVGIIKKMNNEKAEVHILNFLNNEKNLFSNPYDSDKFLIEIEKLKK